MLTPDEIRQRIVAGTQSNEKCRRCGHKAHNHSSNKGLCCYVDCACEAFEL